MSRAGKVEFYIFIAFFRKLEFYVEVVEPDARNILAKYFFHTTSRFFLHRLFERPNLTFTKFLKVEVV